MKRSISTLLILFLLVSLIACGATTPDENDQSNTPVTESTETSVSVDKNLLTVDITFPATWFENEDMANFDFDAYVKENDFKKAVMNADGSVVVTMTKGKHQELLEIMEDEIYQTFDDLIEGEDTPYIKAISQKSKFGQVTVDVERIGYEDAFFEMTPFLIGYAAMFYQVMAGDELHCEVVVRDIDTKDIIGTTIYPDALEE